ncbi:MAG: 50S ribosomal protein L2 [Candidatus Doudnabacteria bacterium RIFCSPHIGHO2_01_FULL_50_11]|uniref:Large ribosomal subunit protein uL2 n=1 Tax=Candidatus Doudnabacteria bacterium RIFCSPHIGHO2_01_FULL_50_11 TaxID=1817828 RepID=A0A1F5PMW9_9BACT|nr:ribosomal protein L2 [uncultured bacterium]OGE91259.1 MAG: 50S ribosomal protein L2 [Candidatus Doudnabacteria bacterium RIFCSPHIGHO2_01_FULL_50_11]
MSIKIYKPTTPGRRETSVLDYAKLLDKKVATPKRLLVGQANSGGRNSQGKITVRHRGGGYRKIIRVVDFRRDKINIPARVQTVEYDPNRTAFLSLIAYRDGEKRFILTPDGLKVGDEVVTSDTAPIKAGNRLPLAKIPIGTFVHDVELLPGAGGKMARSAGTYVTVQAVEENYILLKMPSGEIRKVPARCWATIGQVSNPQQFNIRWGKAGRMRHMGIKPTVRGKAMNPVDHPHGGGEGHNPIGMKYPKTPWGKHALGVKTRKRKKYSNQMIIKRRSK